MRRGADWGLAALPMYDRPELRAATDALWAHLREAIRDIGLDAPEALDRRRPMRLLWSAPELVLGQTCGLPLVSALKGRVGLLGTPAYAIEGCPPGTYRSALVVRADHPADGLAALVGCRAAVNARDSQSGYGALMHETAAFAREGRFFADVVLTGSHAGSIEAVAAGRADLAAIDAVTWALALRHDGAGAPVGRLRVLGWSETTPGLPYITGQRRHAAAIAGAVERAIPTLAGPVREALLISGFARTRIEDYAVIGRRLAAAHAVNRLPAVQG